MDYKFSLHAGDIGTYDWGSLLIRFASLAKVAPRAAVEIMAGAMQDIAVWKTGSEFRGYVALLHEFVHYLQDTHTGLGQWDYLVRREYTTKMLEHSRFLSWTFDSNPPYVQSKLKKKNLSVVSEYLKRYQTDLKHMNKKLAYAPFGDISNERSKLILKYLRSVESKIPVQFEAGDEEPFTIQSLLEAEAAAMCYIQLTGLKMNDEQWEIVQDHHSLYNPGAMPEVYTRTIRYVLTVMEHIFDTNIDEESTWSDFVLRFTMLLTIFLVDLACAYPTPDQLKSLGPQKDYEPGIRFIRLLNAFQLLAGKKIINDFIKAIQNRQFDEAESYLLQECEFPYLRATDIYDSWLSFYGKMSTPSDDPVFSFRKNCMKQRVKDFSSYVRKEPFLLFEKTHLYWITVKGVQSMGSSPEQYDLETQRDYLIEFLAHNKDWGLVNFFIGSGKFVCPLAETRLCNAATPICLSGIQRLEQFPPEPGCLVRANLRESGFSLTQH